VNHKELSKAERTRQFIIEKTAVIFNKKGYAGTSLSDLTEATGLTKGSIYGNFQGKEDVAVAVFDYNCSRVSDRIRQLVDKETTYYDKLMVYAKVYANTALAERGGCPILNTAVEADDTNNLLKDKAAKAVIRWRNSLTDLINGGIAGGEFKTDVDVNQSALSIIALIEGGIMIAKVTNSKSNLENVLGTVEILIDQMKE
jgi:TetR/AcrR family transcriptional repressor of nem operon